MARILATARVLPANVLRFYIEFTGPAKADFDRDQVRLTDSGGNRIEDAFLLLGHELWSPDGRRLTHFMEPGRIKRGMGASLAHLPVFVLSEEYRPEIGFGGRSRRKQFAMAAPQLTSLNEADWKLAQIPRARSRDRLLLRFDRLMDGALVDEIAILTPSGSC